MPHFWSSASRHTPTVISPPSFVLLGAGQFQYLKALFGAVLPLRTCRTRVRKRLLNRVTISFLLFWPDRRHQARMSLSNSYWLSTTTGFWRRYFSSKVHLSFSRTVR